MILDTLGPMLRHGGIRHDGVWYCDGVEICAGGVRKFYYVPVSAKRLWVVAHDRRIRGGVVVRSRPSKIFVSGRQIVVYPSFYYWMLRQTQNGKNAVYLELLYE